MGAATNRKRTTKTAKTNSSLGRMARWLLLLVVLAVVGWFAWVYQQIQATARVDNAQPADAIAVFGAAEYAGRPSPVLHARLDKAVGLYQRGMAPFIITLGGGGDKNSGKTEGGVGRDYLLAQGVPFDHIIAETESIDTEQQVNSLAQLAAQRHWQHVVVVSDGTHLFRIAALCRRAGLQVYTSPRAPLGHIDELDAAQRLLHEMLSYTSLRLDLHASQAHRWIEARKT
jgi:uncharacterized SAM-binding protein YcdF (DUF218 family)